MLARALLISLLWLDSALATTYYVGKSGSDANSCATAQSSTAGNRKLTINGALGCLGGSDADGDTSGAGHTVIVGDGTYAETLQNTIRGGSGTDARFVLQAENRGTCGSAGGTCNVTLAPTSGACGGLPCHGLSTDWPRWVTIDGLYFDASNVTNQGLNIGYDFWVVQYCKIYNAYYSAILSGGSGSSYHHIEISNSGLRSKEVDYHWDQGGPNDVYLGGNDNEISYLYVHDSSAGITAWNDVSVPARNYFHHNRIEPPGAAVGTSHTRVLGTGIGLNRGADNKAYNNICAGSCSLLIGYGCTDCQLYNNTVYAPNNNFGGYCVDVTADTTRPVIKNNIFRSCPTGAINNQGTGTLTESNNLTADPSFVNAATGSSGDFHLQSGSAARDAGTTLAAVTVDFDGISRPQNGSYDIGAYEYIVSSSSTASTGNMSRAKGLMGIR